MGTARKKQEIEIEGRRVALTNVDKVLYPSGFTKGQVIEFYIPARFKPKVKWIPPEQRGKILTFPVDLKKSA